MNRPLIPADPEIWRRTGHAVPACTADACRQGRAQCPCPEACELPERGEGSGVLIWAAVGAAILGALVKVFG